MAERNNEFDFDFIVIGSGFGGSVSAHRLVEKGYRVAVMEMGRRWTPDNLPHTSWSIHRWLWRPKLGLRGFFNIQFFRHATIFHGSAVGGGSITYACTLLAPPEKVWAAGSWTGLSDWKAEMPQHYETASRMLGVTENRILGPADHLLKKAAEASGSGHTFYCTKVGIFQPAEGEPGGKTFPDPFFGGEGPARTTCIACGGCMMGCRYGAKNTLDLGYLYLAEKHGARGLSRNQGGERQTAGWRQRWQRRIRSEHRQVYGVDSPPAPAVHLPRGGLLRLLAGHDGTSLSSQRKRLIAGHQQPAGPTRAHQFRIAHRGTHTGLLPGCVAGHRDRLRRLY